MCFLRYLLWYRELQQKNKKPCMDFFNQRPLHPIYGKFDWQLHHLCLDWVLSFYFYKSFIESFWLEEIFRLGLILYFRRVTHQPSLWIVILGMPLHVSQRGYNVMMWLAIYYNTSQLQFATNFHIVKWNRSNTSAHYAGSWTF